MIRFKVSKDEHRTIMTIADRASAMALESDLNYPRTEAAMDITAVHANDCKLKLRELASAEPFDFAHDVFGIRRHLDRATGKLGDSFYPRYAA